MPYAVRTHAPRPSCFFTVVVGVDDCSVGETTGARSSMQKTSRRKDRGAMYVMRHACPRRSGRDYLAPILLPIFPVSNRKM